MSTEQNLYLKLVAFSIANDESSIPDGIDAVNWQSYNQFCEEQAILGIGFQGIEKLKEKLGNDLNIPQELLLQWIGIAEQIKLQNQLINNRVRILTTYLADQNKRFCLLKGQGNARMYPNPLLRTPGDIDVWLEGSNEDIVRFVHERYPGINEQYHHMDYPYFDDVEVEVHYYPSFCYNKLHNHRLQKYFRENGKEQFGNQCKEGFAVPTESFNLVFQLSHMMRHFFTQGIGLRHAIDYYYLLQQPITDDGLNETIEVMKRTGMYKFFLAVLWIECEILGLKKRNSFATPNKKAGRMVLREMLKGGNFGRQYGHKIKGIIPSYAEQMSYSLRYLYEFPSEPLSRPFALVWDYVRKHIIKSIFL